MSLQKKSKKGSIIALICCLAIIGIVIICENFLNLPYVFFTVMKKSAVYSLVAVSMNLLNGFTGLFSLGQAGFMLLGAYTYAIFSVPSIERESVYYLYGSAVNFSLKEVFGKLFGDSGIGGAISLVMGVITAMIFAGIVAALFAWLIGLPVLKLNSDYLAIATLGFAEIIRAVFQWSALGPVTNGANMIIKFPTFSSFNITDSTGVVKFKLETAVPFIVSMVCITIIVKVINSSYGRAFKAIREDEIAAEAMGINLAKHKMISFCTSAFFAGIGGAMFAMFATNAQAMVYTSTMTYEILLIVVIGGIGSITGSVIATFLYVACSEWWLRFLDVPTTFANGTPVPLLKTGFRMVVFSVIIMIVVLFFRRGIMGNKELPDLFKPRKKASKKEAAK